MTAFVVVTAVALGLGPVKVWVLTLLGVAVFGPTFYACRALQAALGRPFVQIAWGAAMNDRRLRISGIHPTSLICSDVERSGFYRNLLGMLAWSSRRSGRTRGAAASSFGDEEGRPAPHHPSRVSGVEGSVGRGSTHHLALSVGSDESWPAGATTWPARAFPSPRHGPDLLQLGLPARSHGHILELATVGPGLTVTSHSRSSGADLRQGRPIWGSAAVAVTRVGGPPPVSSGRRPTTRALSAHLAALAGTWVSRGAEVAGGPCSPAGAPCGQHRGQCLALTLGQRPHLLVLGDAEGNEQSPAAPVLPQRFWLISRSEIDMLCACARGLRTTSAAQSSPAAM